MILLARRWSSTRRDLYLGDESLSGTATASGWISGVVVMCVVPGERVDVGQELIRHNAGHCLPVSIRNLIDTAARLWLRASETACNQF